MGVVGGERSGVAAGVDALGEARLRLVVRNASDIARLRQESRSVPRLPQSGVRVLVEGLPAAAAARLEDRTRRYVRACGCGEGAAAALLILGVAAIYRGLEISARGWRAGDALFAAAALVAAGVGTAAAKLGAIAWQRRRFEKCCEETIAIIARRGEPRKGEA